MKKKNPLYVRKNTCPYCSYFCDSAGTIGEDDERHKPRPGDISFCLMCCEASQFNEKFKLIKFDLNTIQDLLERNRIKMLQAKCFEFWDKHPDVDGRRAKFLKMKDKLDAKGK